MARTVRAKAEKLPPAPTILGAYDQSVGRTLGRARTFATKSIQVLLPEGPTGNLRKATRARVRKVPEGYSLSILPSRRVRYTNRRAGARRSPGGGVSAREVARWVEDGTSGPIVPRESMAFRLPNGWSAGSVSGQRAQRPFARFRQGPGMAVRAMIIAGAEDAAKAIERVIE